MEGTDILGRPDWGEEFLKGGGEMGALTRAYDWASSPLGPPRGWPQSLKTVVRLILTTEHPMLVWWGPDLIQFYNDAYRRTMGPERHPSALGQRGRDCWEEIWDIIGPQIEQVLAGEGATWHEDQLVPVTRHGSREDVYWTYSYSPIDEADSIGGVLVVCKDVTEQHNLTQTLRGTNARLADETHRLRQFFRQAPGFMCLLNGRSHVYELANDAYLDLVGRRDLVGKSVVEALPEVAGQGFLELLDQVYSSGEPFVGRGSPVALQREANGRVETRYVDFVYQPVFGIDGAITGIFVEGSDVTDRVLAERRQQLLITELHHRVKNNLATVQAIAGATARSAETLEEFETSFTGRIITLSKAHSALWDSGRQMISVSDLLRISLDPHDIGEGRTTALTGPGRSPRRGRGAPGDGVSRDGDERHHPWCAVGTRRKAQH